MIPVRIPMNQLDASAPYFRQSRAERLIAIGRATLSVFSLLAVWLDPTEPARYAEASAVRVGLWVEDERVRIEVADDGRGFPFEGDLDLAGLREAHLGPATLRDRIAALGGSLRLHSSRQGSRLDMTVPLESEGA
jgi:glucose-6-phosphate-specific signal transduction histidine kinase